MIALLLAGVAAAEEPVGLDPPLPLAGDPWSAEVVAYALPAQDPAWLTDAARFRSCTVAVVLQPDGTAEPAAEACPEPMVAAALDATRLWRLRPVDGEAPEGSTRVLVHYVVRYDATIGTMTLHAQIDPGAEAAFRGERGAPGVKLVHPAAAVREVHPKLPGSARKAGLGPTTCRLRVGVDGAGDAHAITVEDCPEALTAHAEKTVGKWRFSPFVTDGMSAPAEVVVEVVYR